MKKIMKLFSILFLITLALVGCSSSDKNDAKKVAEEFVRNIYMVDAKKVAEFKTSFPEAIGVGDTLTKQDEVIKIFQSLDKNIQSLMTKEGYEDIVRCQFNTVSTGICAKGNYTAQITDFTLGENLYGEDNDKVRYRYEVKLKFISADGKSEQTDASTGAVELIKENGSWKVCLCTINQFPKLYK